MKSLITTALIILVCTSVIWPLVMVFAVHLMKGDASAARIAFAGGVSARELPFSAYWIAGFAPLFMVSTAVAWRKFRTSLPVLGAMMGAVASPIAFKLADGAYGANTPSCLPDPTIPGSICGLPPIYHNAFIAAGCITGLLLGLAVANLKLAEATK
jgi:hypothetical protein